MPTFIELKALREQSVPNTYVAIVLADIDDNGTYEEVEYGVVPGDTVGIAPQVMAAVVDWINHSKPVTAFVPPTAEEIRASMPGLSRRQLLLGLHSICIAEAQVDEALAHDVEGMIEWKNASVFKRTHPLISGLSVIFGLPPEQVDSLWLWAAEI